MSVGGAEAGIRPRRLRLAGLAVSVILVLTAVVLAIVGGSGGEAAQGIDTAPHLVDVAALTELESSLGHSVYWAGERPPARLELKEEGEGSVYLRYLPPGVEAGDPEQLYLTVGTYPVPDAVAALARAAAQSGEPLRHLEDGGVVLPNSASEGSVYLAYPESDLQIEVYDPTPGRSLRLIRSGAIQPLG
jgi:hypothetical protein